MSDKKEPKPEPKPERKKVKIISDGSVAGIKVMFEGHDLIQELSIRSVKWVQNGNNQPICMLEIYDVQMDSAVELFTKVVSSNEPGKNGASGGKHQMETKKGGENGAGGK